MQVQSHGSLEGWWIHDPKGKKLTVEPEEHSEGESWGVVDVVDAGLFFFLA